MRDYSSITLKSSRTNVVGNSSSTNPTDKKPDGSPTTTTTGSGHRRHHTPSSPVVYSPSRRRQPTNTPHTPVSSTSTTPTTTTTRTPTPSSAASTTSSSPFRRKIQASRQALPIPVPDNMDNWKVEEGTVDYGLIYQLIHCRDWAGVVAFLNAVPEAASLGGASAGSSGGALAPSPLVRTSSSLSRHSRTGSNDLDSNNKNHADNSNDQSHPVAAMMHGNLPLHEACKQQPPREIIQQLLTLHPAATHQAGQYGYLPLHFACSTGASAEIVSLLIETDPTSPRMREDLDDALPLHLATQWGANEDVVMELLTAHPEGSLIEDGTGKTALDYAKALPVKVHQGKLISALETAPILIATSQAAAQRVVRDYEQRLQGMQLAHKEYNRQLEGRYKQEQSDALAMEIDFSNTLAHEKERNIELAERIVHLQQREAVLQAERDAVKEQIANEQDALEGKLKNQERELKTIMSRAIGKAAGLSTKADDKEMSRALPGADSESMEDQDQQDVLQQVSQMAQDHQSAQSRIQGLEADLSASQKKVQHLNELNSSKDARVNKLSQQKDDLHASKTRLMEEVSTLSDSETKLKSTLKSTNDTLNRLYAQAKRQALQLATANRRNQVQESRLGSIKNWTSTLSSNIATWQKEDEAAAKAQNTAAAVMNENDNMKNQQGDNVKDKIEVSRQADRVDSNPPSSEEEQQPSPTPTAEKVQEELMATKADPMTSPDKHPNSPECEHSDEGKSLNDTTETASLQEEEDEMSALTSSSAAPASPISPWLEHLVGHDDDEEEIQAQSSL